MRKHKMINDHQHIAEEYRKFITDKSFPCIGAKASLAKNQASCMIAGNMACPADDKVILDYLYNFIDNFRKEGNDFYSTAIIFTGPLNITVDLFETLLWQRLQSLLNLDAATYKYDNRVSPDTSSPEFSFSLKEESFFIIGLHPASSRPARQFCYPALVFNPHSQFENLRTTTKYENMKLAIRKKDIAIAGSVNPMLSDHGKNSEVVQYSGKNYIVPLECPLNINHEK